ncbi:MAG: hypothetical protein ABIS01_16120, partial [Ferruginibacter sp.]
IDNITDYRSEQALIDELQKQQKEIKFKELQYGLDSTFDKEYEDGKFKPLTPLVEAYKNIYGVLPKGHPQKEFE